MVRGVVIIQNIQKKKAAAAAAALGWTEEKRRVCALCFAALLCSTSFFFKVACSFSTEQTVLLFFFVFPHLRFHFVLFRFFSYYFCFLSFRFVSFLYLLLLLGHYYNYQKMTLVGPCRSCLVYSVVYIFVVVVLLMGLFDGGVRSVHAVDVPSNPREPLPGASRGTVDALVRTYHEVFSPDLLEQLTKEAPLLDSVGKSRLLKNSKRQTFWLPVGAGAPKPRFAIEHAVNLLFELLHENTYED